MNSVIFTAEIVLVWLSSLFNGTGLGHVYHTNSITNAALVGLSAIFLLRHRRVSVQKDTFYTFCATMCIFVFSGLLHKKEPAEQSTFAVFC